MPRGTLDFLEEPIRDETPEAYEQLRRMTDVPFAIGEEFSSKWQALPYIERGITNYMRLDVCNIGGFTEAMKVAGWCEAHYIDLMPHNPLGPICTAATVHLAAAVPNFFAMEVRQSPTGHLPRATPARWAALPGAQWPRARRGVQRARLRQSPVSLLGAAKALPKRRKHPELVTPNQAALG